MREMKPAEYCRVNYAMDLWRDFNYCFELGPMVTDFEIEGGIVFPDFHTFDTSVYKGRDR